MATPTWLAFPLTTMARSQLVLAARGALAEWGFRVHGFSKLLPTPDGGVDCSAETVECDDERKVLALSSDWPGVVITYNVLPIRDNVYLYFWPYSGQTAFRVQFGSSALAFHEGLLAEGEWLERTVCGVTALFGARGSAYGDDDRILSPLNLDDMLNALRRGGVPAHRGPACYLVSTELMGEEESRLIASRIGSQFGYSYRLLGSGLSHLFQFGAAHTRPEPSARA